MPVFKELMDTKRLEEPEARQAEGLVRSNKRAGRRLRKTSTSVTQGTYLVTMRVLAVVAFLAVAALVVFLLYLGVTSFIPK